MKATDVLEAQALLRDRLSEPAYARYMQVYMDDMARKASGPFITDPSTGKPSGWYFCKREQNRLEFADSYFLAAEMMPLVKWAANGLDDEIDHFTHAVWPTDYGFIVLEDAMISTEVWGRTISTKAFSWGRSVDPVSGRPGTVLNFYTDINDSRDQVGAAVKIMRAESMDTGATYDLLDKMGTLHVHHCLWIPDGMAVGPADFIPSPDYAKWATGGMALAESATNEARFFLALLMLLNQTVTTLSKAEADKRTSKRLRRMKMPTGVTVIQLRRHKGSNRKDDESLVEWAHRWVVKGHWRNQPYADGVTRRIWIAPYVKGPEDKPLVQTQKVYALVR